jgi:hypothetical protein
MGPCTTSARWYRLPHDCCLIAGDRRRQPDAQRLTPLLSLVVGPGRGGAWALVSSRPVVLGIPRARFLKLWVAG